jgi:hypothetical protein
MYPEMEQQKGNENKKHTGQKTDDTHTNLLDGRVNYKPPNQSPPRLPLQPKLNENDNNDEEGICLLRCNFI